MTLTPLLDAPAHIQIHAGTAMVALVLGPWIIARPRRDRLHKLAGYVWAVSLAVAALSSFAISGFAWIGPFSPIHALSVLALWSLFRGVAAAIQGDIPRHQATFRGLYWRGVIFAGLFTLLPGRIVNRALLPDTPDLGYALIALGLAVLLWRERRASRTPRFGRAKAWWPRDVARR